MAKLGATRQPVAPSLGKAPASCVTAASPSPVVPITEWTPWAAHHRAFSTAEPGTVKSTATSAPAPVKASNPPAIGTSGPAEAPHRGGVDGRHQLEVGGTLHRRAHGHTHAACCSDHPHSHGGRQ